MRGLPDFDAAPSYHSDIKAVSLQRLEALLVSTLRSGTTASPNDAKEHEIADTRQQDQQLVDMLSQYGFQGPAFELFNEHLVVRGYRICLALIASGKMNAECRLRNRPVGDFPTDMSSQDHRDLAADTAVEGAGLFKRVALMGGRWSPRGGASLFTYYVGACIQTYPTIYRRWYRYHHHWRSIDLYDVPPDIDSVRDHDGSVGLRVMLKHVLSGLDEYTYVALGMSADGRLHREIGEVLGCDIRTVERLLSQGRKMCREALRRMGVDGDWQI